MLLSHLVRDSTLDTTAEGLSLIKGAHEALLSRVLQVAYVMRLVVTLQKFVQQAQSFTLLHRPDLQPVREEVNLWLVLALAPHFRFKDFHIKAASRISYVILYHVIIQLVQMVQFVWLDASRLD